MEINEKEVHVTPDGLGRAAIVERSDGLFCIYTHWMWSRTAQDDFNVEATPLKSWAENDTPLHELYEGISPEPSIYATLAEARLALLSLPGFVDEDASEETIER
jgi:hypothetical protein